MTYRLYGTTEAFRGRPRRPLKSAPTTYPVSTVRRDARTSSRTIMRPGRGIADLRRGPRPSASVGLHTSRLAQRTIGTPLCDLRPYWPAARGISVHRNSEQCEKERFRYDGEH